MSTCSDKQQQVIQNLLTILLSYFVAQYVLFFLVTNFRSKRRELPTWINFYANLLSLSTHMSNGPLLGKMYNSSAVNLINLPLLLSKKSLPAEQRIIEQN